MKILAVNGSPRGEHGNTDRILQPFLAGARETGADTETIYLKDKKINHCTGCFACWTKTPGVCVHKDDMPELLAKVQEADVMVYATPLYVFTVSGLMKDFMDRFIPLLKPYIVKRGDQYIHPKRNEGVWPKRVVLISNCGFPERHHFSGLVETFRCFTSGPDLELSATILCPAGEVLKIPELHESTRWYVEASHQAGREVAEHGRITPETQEILDRDLIDPEVYSQAANAHWDSVIVHQLDPEAVESAATGTLSPPLPLPPLGKREPETFLEVITGQAAVFNAAAAGNLRADIQFIVTGQEPGEYLLRIANGQCTAHEGTVPATALTIHTPSEVWLQIARGELSGQTAFMKGLYRTEGDFGLLLRMNKLFSKKSSSAQ
jgi:putative sterol carrier protein/putative NADPH-quinone reductase